MVTYRKYRALKGKRRKFKRKFVRKRISRRSSKINRFRAPLGNFPPRKTVALRYVDSVTLDPSGSAAGTYIFRVNNIYDPDYTGSGHQPMYRDNYTAIYSEYKVNYATITFTALTSQIVNTTTSNAVTGLPEQLYAGNQRAVRMYILRDGDPTGPTDIDSLIEEGNTNMVWRFCPQNTSQKMPTLRMQCWPHKQLNLGFKDDALQALAGAGPSKEAYFILGAASMGAGSDPFTLPYSVMVTYNVTFFNLKKFQTQN